MFVAFSIAGHYCEFFYAFHLLNIIFNNQLLQRVIKALTMNGAHESRVSSLESRSSGRTCCQTPLRAGMSLIWVALLCMVIMYLFAIVAFMFLRRLMWPVADAYAYCTYAPPQPPLMQ